MNILERLYEHELNAQISTFWDEGYEAKLGDPNNGWKASQWFDTYAEAEKWLWEAACKNYAIDLDKGSTIWDKHK